MRKLLLFVLILLVACSSEKEVNIDEKNRDYKNLDTPSVSIADIKLPEFPQINVYEDDRFVVDHSNDSQGYFGVMVKDKNHEKLKIQIKKDDLVYNYDLNKDNEFETLPLNMGDGKYTIKIFENIEGTRYAARVNINIDVKLESQNIEYLYPNQVIDYDKDSEAVIKSFELVNDKKNDLERVRAIYEYIVNNIDYDWDKVEIVRESYVLPIIDDTLRLQKGICFDYAALMSAMLRVQNIPTRLVTGYVEDGYHAWIEVYIDNIGWIAPHIFFENNRWKLIDPTFDAMGNDYQGKYEVKYQY